MVKLLLIYTLFLPLSVFPQSGVRAIANIKVDKMPQFAAGNKALAKMFLDSIDQPGVKWEEVDDSDLRTELVLSMMVTEQGKVEDVRVIKSLNARYDARCVNLARKLTFIPAMQNGKPVKVRFTLPLSFDF